MRLVTRGLIVAAALTLFAGSVSGARPHSGDWTSWQRDSAGSRFNAAEVAINPVTASKLKLKWAFTHNVKGSAPKSQPAVVGDDIFFGGVDGKFYARNARTGAPKWSFDLLPGGQAIDGPAVARGKIFFGDSKGFLYALDQQSGKALWAKDTEPHEFGMHTSSPLYHNGLVYIGASSWENVEGRDYPCCTFRGHIDAFDAETGDLVWRHFTVPEPKPIGTWPSGATMYGPSGAGVWSSPVVDPQTDTVYVGTGQNYSGSGGDFDTLLALDARTGNVRWRQQVTKADTWRLLCDQPDNDGYCPGQKDGTALDYDLGATPAILRVNGRTLVGIGQKSGVYHVFDASTGAVQWRRQLSTPQPVLGATFGLQWGASYDGERIYAATYNANPGTVFALNPANGDVIWKTPNPANGCTTGGAAAFPDICKPAHGVPVTSTRGLVYVGSSDGKMRVYSSKTGSVLWEFDTVRDFDGVNGVTGRGGSIAGNGAGAVIANGMLYINSGYWDLAYPTDHGPVLLAFTLS